MDKKICQSCAMPMNPDDYGTEKDASPTDKYCKYCYEGGKFTDNGTMESMIATCVTHMKEAGVPEEDATTYLERTLPGLERWKQG